MMNWETRNEKIEFQKLTNKYDYLEEFMQEYGQNLNRKYRLGKQ